MTFEITFVTAYVCENPECSENGVAKKATQVFDDSVVCGGCAQPTVEHPELANS